MASDPSDVRVDMAAGTNGRAAGSNGSGDGYGDEIKAVGHAERFRQTVDPSQSRQESVTANSSPWQVAGRRRMGYASPYCHTHLPALTEGLPLPGVGTASRTRLSPRTTRWRKSSCPSEVVQVCSVTMLCRYWPA
eukprot:264021-Rhodomonas_salina.2